MKNSLSPETGRLYPKAIVAVAAGAVGIAALKGCVPKSGFEMDTHHSSMHGTVVKIERMTLACNARTTIHEGGQSAMDLKVLSKHVSGSGFTFYLRNGRGKPGTDATVKTLTCINTPNMVDNVVGDKHNVTIERAGISLYSSYADSEHSVVVEDNPLAAVGEAISKGIKGFTLGHVNTYDGYAEELKGKGSAFTEDYGLYSADTKCGPAALQATESVMTQAYVEQAVQKGIPANKVQVTWTGSLSANAGQYTHLGQNSGEYSINPKEFTSDDCKLASDLLSNLQNDVHLYEPSAPGGQSRNSGAVYQTPNDISLVTKAGA